MRWLWLLPLALAACVGAVEISVSGAPATVTGPCAIYTCPGVLTETHEPADYIRCTCACAGKSSYVTWIASSHIHNVEQVDANWAAQCREDR